MEYSCKLNYLEEEKEIEIISKKYQQIQMKKIDQINGSNG